MTGRGSAAAAAALLGLVLAGCSSQGAGAGGAAGEAASDDRARSDGARPETTSPGDLPRVPALREERGIVQHLQLDECPTSEGPGRAAGEVTNPADTVRDVVVVLNWTNDTYDVLARSVTVLEGLRPGSTEQWSVEVDLQEGVTTCTPSARSGELRSPG